MTDHLDRPRGPPVPRRREREDRVHDAIIEERINRERPCRTLFVRNIKASLYPKASERDPMLLGL